MIERVRWQKGVLKSFCDYLRDILIACYPFRRLPRLARIFLLGVDPDFVFLVHPRRKEDIFIAWPFAKPARFLLGRNFYRWIQGFPPTILDVIKTPHGVTGIIISSTWLPESLIHNRTLALRNARKCLRFAARISRKKAYVGLGEWWPFLTRRGEAVRKYADLLGIRVTSGYFGTLCSLLLSTEKIAKISGVELSKLKVLILGVGKMGSLVARVITDKVEKITIFDRNRAKQDRVAFELSFNSNGGRKATISLVEDSSYLKTALQEHDLCICTTSNLRRLFKPEDLPENILILDDARPEAVPRIYDKEKRIIVLEGGLLKIKDLKLHYDFGFGNDENVFGCLGETFILACDNGKTLIPTIGNSDLKNFWCMYAMLKNFSTQAGDFKSGQVAVNPQDIKSLIHNKRHLQSEEMPRIQ